MHSIVFLASLTGLIAPTAAFWRLPCKTPIVVERADPIINPGKVSGHLHTIMGGNGFGFTMDYPQARKSTCSSCTVSADMSNYWTPTLFYKAQDGKFHSVDQNGGATVYYLQRGDAGEKLHAFPEGFRMVAGNPFKRSYDGSLESQAINYHCLDYNGPNRPETNGFPTANCPDGLRSQVFFPACWDGVNLDSPDHVSHMSYPVGSFNSGECPPSHPVHMISLFYEIIWNVNDFKDMWYGNQQPFVWSMGDPTGYGFHGDFVNGWDIDVLQKAVDECTNLSGNVEDCPVFQPLVPDATAEGCRIGASVNEETQGILAALPGCNPIQQGPAAAVPVPNCAVIASIGTPDSFFTDLTNTKQWAYMGCGSDSIGDRILTAASNSNAQMSVENCVDFCTSKGYTVAGMEFADECYCGAGMPTKGLPVAGLPGACTMKCAGDSGEYCGGAGTISLYKKCSGGSCQNVQFGAVGNGTAAVAPVGSSAAISSTVKAATSLAAVVSPLKATPSSTIAAMSSPSTSKAIPAVSSSSMSSAAPVKVSPTTTVMSPPSAPAKVASTTAAISSPAKASSSSTSTSKALSLPATVSIPASLPLPTSPANSKLTLPTSWSNLGCYMDPVFPRALDSWGPIHGTDLTTSKCVAWCATNGFLFAGTENGGQCFCGHQLLGSGKAAESDCKMPCEGGAGEVCGGPGRLSLFGLTKGTKKSKRGYGHHHFRRHGVRAES